VFAAGLIVIAAASYATHVLRQWRAVRRFRAVWKPRGKDVLLVYSNSPHWLGYVEDTWLPRWGHRAVVLNWSDRPLWKRDRWPEVALFRMFAGDREFNPLAIVVPSEGRRAASFASGARSAITSMARTGCCGLRRRSSKGTSRRGRDCCRGVFESWHISDGNYPPLRVGDLVNLSLSSSRRRWTAWMTASLPSNISTPATIASLQEYCVYGATVRTRSRSLIPRASRFRG
jgi:hypothetical protein